MARCRVARRGFVRQRAAIDESGAQTVAVTDEADRGAELTADGVERGVAAELALAPVAPAAHTAGGEDRARGVPPGGNGRGPEGQRHLDRLELAPIGRVADVAGVVAARVRTTSFAP